MPTIPKDAAQAKRVAEVYMDSLRAESDPITLRINDDVATNLPKVITASVRYYLGSR
jgi:hypothetical protein